MRGHDPPRTAHASRTLGVFAVVALALLDCEVVRDPVTRGLGADVVMLVGDSSNPHPNDGDRLLAEYLTRGGRIVALLPASTTVPAELLSARAVVLSSSTKAAEVGGKFRDLSVGIVVMESWAFHDMGLTGATIGTDAGVLDAQSTISITLPSHPLANHLSGLVTVSTSPAKLNWGVPGAGGTSVASLAPPTQSSALLAFEKGAALDGGGAAPARRVGVFLRAENLVTASSDALALIAGTVDWAGL